MCNEQARSVRLAILHRIGGPIQNGQICTYKFVHTDFTDFFTDLQIFSPFGIDKVELNIFFYILSMF